MENITMDNQQRSFLSWLAGIIDGEGWVGLNKRYGKNRQGYRVGIQISNRDIRILKRGEEIIKKYYGIKGYWGKHIPIKHKKGTPHIWFVGLRLENLLKDLKPLCQSKCDEIGVLINYIEYKKVERQSESNFHNKIDLEKEAEFYAQLRQIRERRPFREYTQSILS